MNVFLTRFGQSTNDMLLDHTGSHNLQSQPLDVAERRHKNADTRWRTEFHRR